MRPTLTTRKLLTAVLLWALLPLFLGGQASAQIFAFYLVDKPKVLKKHKDRMVTVNGRPAVIGEIKMNGAITLNGLNMTTNRQIGLELWVSDPDKPELPAYRMNKKGKVEPGSKKTVLRLDWSHVPLQNYATVFMANESLPGFSREYSIRREQIEEFRADRDSHDKASTEWAARHVRLITALEGMQTWMGNTLWPKAAAKLEKEIAKESKVAKREALRARHDKAMASIQTIEVPQALPDVSQESFSGRHKFKARESQHIRIYFHDSLSAGAVEQALRMGEEIIEGFRTQFVDPYLAEDYDDRIPDGVFHEFLFTPESGESFVAYSKGLWGVDWSQRREERIEMGGGRSDGAARRPYRNWRRLREPYDVDGMVSHALGHSLSGLHFGPDGNMRQDWLSEGMGYFISFEILGRNAVTCKEFDRERSGYVKQQREREEGEKTVGEGRRDLYNQVALELGRPIEHLARRELFEMDDADLAKSWSFFDYIARKEGKNGQLWLRAAARHSFDEKTFLANWREDAASILGVDPGQAFKVLDERWRSYASGEQDKSDNPKRRRR